MFRISGVVGVAFLFGAQDLGFTFLFWVQVLGFRVYLSV